MSQMRGGAFNIHIKGLDELHVTHDNIMFEACCCSFQVRPTNVRAPGRRAAIHPA